MLAIYHRSKVESLKIQNLQLVKNVCVGLWERKNIQIIYTVHNIIHDVIGDVERKKE